MIDLNEFIKETGLKHSDISPYWQDATRLAESILPKMPDIGFLSRGKRIFAFLYCCSMLEEMIDEIYDQKIGLDAVEDRVGIVAILIMRKLSAKFDKAYTLFTIMVLQKRINRLQIGRLAFKLALTVDPNF